jgi:hypothetical protein
MVTGSTSSVGSADRRTIAIGSLLAVLDRRWIGRPVFGMLLVTAAVGGLIITRVSPFSFGTGSYYMDGVILSAGSALALIGYFFGIVCQFVRRRSGGHSHL